MAPTSTSASASKSKSDPPSNPLADYFWIAGVDGAELLDLFTRLGEEYDAKNNNSQSLPVTDTIEEDADAENEVSHLSDSSSPRPSSKRNSSLPLTRSSDEARLSFRSMASDFKDTASNRSSMTIKPSQSPNLNGTSFLNLSDHDFDKAISKFTAERDSFLSDLSLSAAGAGVPNRPKPRPKTQKIVAEDVNPLKSGIGSVRRHMSFRDMNSMKRQPSVARQGECEVPITLYI